MSIEAIEQLKKERLQKERELREDRELLRREVHAFETMAKALESIEKSLALIRDRSRIVIG
jgi:predicted nucleotidyltransferase